MALLARPGDTVVVRRRVPEFECYLAEYLGASDVSFLEAGMGDDESLAMKLRTDAELAARLAALLPAGTPLTMHAYLTTGHVWQLAKTLGERLQEPVNIAGPAPRVSRRANDKLWFWSQARELTGVGSVPPTLYVFGPAAAAAQVARFSRSWENVVVKVPSSAGGRGNLRLQSAVLRDMSLSEIRDLVEERLFAIGWRRTYPVLVGVWESGITASPSAQMWLPQREEGPPQILGLFEQRVEGVTGKFSGAQPAAIGEEMAQVMMRQAAVIGALFQRIGYFGPCSLDAVIRETPDRSRELHWVECNARWSGVSIPLAAARRLRGRCVPKGLIILQEILPDSSPFSTSTMCALLDGLMFRSGASEEGVVILSPPDRVEGLSLNVMAVADTQQQAATIIETLHRRINSETA